MLRESVDISLDDGVTWQTKVADETVGGGKTLTVSGLASGNYPVKLRATPLSGGNLTPCISDLVTLVVAAGPGMFNESITALAVSGANVNDIQQMVEALLSSAQSSASIMDFKGFMENCIAQAQAADSVQSALAAVDTVLAAASSSGITATAIQALIESVAVAGTSVVTVADMKSIAEQVIAAATAIPSVTDSQITATPPAIPTYYVSVSPSLVTANITPVAGATGYKIYYRLAALGNPDGTETGATADSGCITVAGTYTFTDTLLGGTSYNFVVSAYNAAGESALGTMKTQTTTYYPPINVALSYVGGNLIVTWDAVAGASQYRVYYSKWSDLNLNLASASQAVGYTNDHVSGRVNVASATASIAGLDVGATYYVCVASYQASSGSYSFLTIPVSMLLGTTVYSEPVTASCTVNPSEADVMTAHENVTAAGQGAASVIDTKSGVQTYTENVTAAGQSAASVMDTYTPASTGNTETGAGGWTGDATALPLSATLVGDGADPVSISMHKSLSIAEGQISMGGNISAVGGTQGRCYFVIMNSTNTAVLYTSAIALVDGPFTINYNNTTIMGAVVFHMVLEIDTGYQSDADAAVSINSVSIPLQ